MPPQIQTAQQRARPVKLKRKKINVCVYGQKIVAKLMDDGYIQQCGEACAKKLKVTAVAASTGREYLTALENAGTISTCIFWGHSWNIGLYLQDNQGLYLDSTYDAANNRVRLPVGAAKLGNINTSNIKTRAHSLFIFASCGTAGAGSYDQHAFAPQFGNYINKQNDGTFGSNETGTKYYKVTTIGATNLSNLYTDGTARTDGQWTKTEKKYRISKDPVFRTVVSGSLWWKKTEQILDHYEWKVHTIEANSTPLGKKLNFIEIINKHDPDDTSIIK